MLSLWCRLVVGVGSGQRANGAARAVSIGCGLAGCVGCGFREPVAHVFAESVPCPGAGPDARSDGGRSGADDHVERDDPGAAAGLGPLCAPPGGGSPGMLPQGPYLDWGNPAATMAEMQRFIQEVRADYHYFAPEGSKPLGFNEIELSTTLAFPFLRNAQTPLLITPGFATYFWQGPNSTMPPAPADMPAYTFDTYLDTAWNPKVNNRFGGELDGRVGVYSDFRGLDTQSLRVTGRALAVLALTPDQVVKVKLGLWYLNRVRYKLLPDFGIVWQPNADTHFDILFPNPKFTQRLQSFGNTEWWWYASGDYGGDAWTIRRGKEFGAVNPGAMDEVDYNDIRIALGLEFKRLTGAGLSARSRSAGRSTGRSTIGAETRARIRRPRRFFCAGAWLTEFAVAEASYKISDLPPQKPLTCTETQRPGPSFLRPALALR